MGDWGIEEPGDYPADGTSEEQNEWNASKEEWDSYVATKKMMEDIDELSTIQIWTGLISSVIAIVAIFMLFQLDPNGYKVTYGWLGITTLSQLWYAWKIQPIMNEYYATFPEFQDSIWMDIQAGSQIGGTLVCNIFLLLIIIMCSIKSSDKGEVEESGFHTTFTAGSTEQQDTQP